MYRPRRNVGPNKQFVPGGVYNQNLQVLQQQQLPSSNLQQVQVVPQQQQQQPQPQQQQAAVVGQKAALNDPKSNPQQQQQQQQQMVQKQETKPVLTAGQESIEVDESNALTTIKDENGKLYFKNIFGKRKKSSVRAKEKRMRQNRQLRKAILPKNALMALNEVKGITVSDFIINNNLTGGFTAVVTVNNKQFEGKGNSKIAAKNNACEKALRDYVLEKMVQNPRRTKSTSSQSQSGQTTNADSATPMDTNTNDSEDNESMKDSMDGIDDVPMVNLASFAIYKLFSEWENEGFLIPEMHPTHSPNSSTDNTGAAQPKEPKQPPIRHELPERWEDMHPATLLCMMRPGLTYTEQGTVGEKPNVLQSIGVDIDGQHFDGYGRSKKLARRNTAAAVCNALFSTNFTTNDP